ncbi:MAG: conjugal transfer protein TraF [Oleiphilus sp.]
MKRTLLVSSILMASQAFANSGAVNPGSSMTTGPSSNSYSVAAGFNNPAMTSLLIDKDENVRTSYFPSFGFNLEVGDANNLVDELEELTDLLDDPDSSGLSTQEALDRFNELLIKFGEDGYVKNSISLTAPFFPLLIQSDMLGGAVGISVAANATAAFSVLDAPLEYSNQNDSFNTATSLYLKSGVEKSVALTYSRDVPLNDWFNDKGNLHAGVKLKVMNLELSKQVIPLENLESDDISDIIVDEYDQNQVSSTEFGIDLGLVWDAGDYRLGLTLENLNSPEFEYGAVGVGCSGIDQNSPSRNACEVAAYFANETGDIQAKETHVKDAMFRADVLYKLTDRWQLTSALDLAEYNDVIGFENQWFHAATSYDADSWIIPSLRFGYHKNLVGSELSSASVGFTLFNTLALDIEYGLETIEVDGTKAPRRAGFALSIEESF